MMILRSIRALAGLFIILTVHAGLSSQEVPKLELFANMNARNIGPAGMSGRVTSIDVVLNDHNTIYIGSAAGGIWKTENSGHTWKPIFENELAASIGDVKVYQKNPSIIYVGTGEGNPRNSQNSGIGIYRSNDGGLSWNHLGLENTRQIHRVLIHPDNPDIVWAGASGASWGESEDRGVYKSTDGGKHWKKILYVNENTGVADMRMDPLNPDKIFVAMWEHRRWPWFFKSGGVGSAIYMSHDGGESWKKLSVENGLPKGELGRIGLSIAPSNTRVVYAYIESESNAIYRSDDGGFSWKKVSKEKDRNIGDRPFYYADIYVDTQNEDRIYSIASEITMSGDGGKTWEVFVPGSKVHTDHHAWWSDPEDSEFIIIGHDGGLNISRDKGKNWWFADNLPLGQFYHVRLDNEFPYNIMGGLQDNGSWRGPSRTWFKGGIRNMYWQRLSVGDGFDVVPDPLEPDYGYAMGQAGNLVRFHAPSGQLYKIMPQHPEGIELRFNWNAGIAIDPIDRNTIYYGSQFLHKSTDKGLSWSIISPDLTTNDPAKQRYGESGGLTYDVTGAENHTTIIAIDPSPLNSELIWVGTDDGNVQFTQDGGKNWINVVSKIPAVPENTWVTQIKASAHNEAEAFVVFDDHRRNNWTPYIYRTRDYGKNWERIVDENDVRGYTFCIEQDPVEPRLLFAGTEFGLYVSFNEGTSWSRWTHGLPTIPVTDLAIHARDHDLVIATFGRAFWVLDNIIPLREMASSWHQIQKKKIHLFETPFETLMAIGESIGYREGKIGDALFEGENRPVGAMIRYYFNGEEGTEIKLDIMRNGKAIRQLKQKAKTGINTILWDMKAARKRMPWQAEQKDDRASDAPGLEVAPGEYEVRLSCDPESEFGTVFIKADPRLTISKTEIDLKLDLIERYNDLIERTTKMADEIRMKEKKLDLAIDFLENSGEELKELKTASISARDSIRIFWEIVNGKQVQGIYRDSETLRSQFFQTEYMLDFPLAPAGENLNIRMLLLEKSIESFEQKAAHLTESLINPLFDKLSLLELNPVK